MSLHTVAEITLDYLTPENKPDRERPEQGISAAQQAIAQASQSAAAQADLSANKLSVQEREAMGSHIEEAFLEVTRPLTPQIRANMVREAARGFRALYIDKAKGEERAAFVLSKLEQGGYDSYDRQFPFTRQLLADLQPTPPDLHLQVRHCLDPIPLDDPDRSLPKPRTEDLTPSQLQILKKDHEKQRAELREINFGVEPAKIIDGTNIGYLKLTAFVGPDFEETYQKIDEAMTRVKDATALIIDLRDNRGGSPHTVSRLASYLFDEKTVMNRVYQRSTDTTAEFCADPDQVFRFGQAKPVCILVGSGTMSAAEEFAYDLQARKRATVIGQKTWGGAHPIDTFVIDDHFYLVIPDREAKNPITDTNWETDGVVPDKVLPESEDACTKAVSLLSDHAVSIPPTPTGPIVLLLGQSSAGKSSILNELERTTPGALSAEQDAYQQWYDAEDIRRREPELYATMLKVFEPEGIAMSVCTFAGLQRVREESTQEEREAALRAVVTMRGKLFPRENSFFETRNKGRMDHIIDESLKRPLVGFDGCSDPREFMEHCSARGFAASVKVGLVYCPLKELARRVSVRNEKALSPGGNPLEVRAAIAPITQFAELYRPAQEGEQVLEVLNWTEVEQIFDTAFAETISFLEARRGGFGDIGDIDEYRIELINRHDQMKTDFMTSLGFVDASIQEMGITPRVQHFDFLFNTKEMSPSASAAVIQGSLMQEGK